MSLLRFSLDTIRSSLPHSVGGWFSITQVRTATKKVSGSKTNKNDSAGRRLGPKVHESNFVKPGQIIMRQRGTKIHPGENTGIGNDHTIFALEPGYVRFYYDPFHPLRKYVGVALKPDLTLPTPHFSPRVRRFGYVQITDTHEAIKEESRMSRKEYLQQNEIKKMEERRTQKDQVLTQRIQEQLSSFVSGHKDEEKSLIVKRLLDTYKFVRLGQSIEDARTQTTFDYFYGLQLALSKGEISEKEFDTSIKAYETLMNEVDSKVCVDLAGNLTKFISESDRKDQRGTILVKLQEYENKLITPKEKEAISELIGTPLIFTAAEKASLLKKYLPSVLPETVKETVINDINEKKVPKNVQVIRKFDNVTKELKVIGRTKEAFLS